ncbi:MAG: bifunctional oligoribonuclease/PAP phosphatase NrnA [Mariprofundales bacterium]|nr:bifunctional oligoribonuclease/PAP phosphatase NrnA [Mariprofundales bacterium]
MRPVRDLNWQPVLRQIAQADGVMLTTHQNPDGDGMGSMIALLLHLRSRGVRAFAHCADPVPRIYCFLAGSEMITHGLGLPEKVDTIISLDCGAKGRLAQKEQFFSGSTLINIDHHASNKNFGDINLIDASYCSTGVMVHDFIAADQGELTVAMAEAIYVTVITDTGNFRHRGVTGDVHRLAAELVDQGVDPERVGHAVYSNNSHARMKLFGLALETMTFTHHDTVAWLYITEESYRQSGADVEDTEGLIDVAASVEKVEIAVFLRPHLANSWKVSFRSRGRIHVGDLAGQLGGGGHPNASGCQINGDLDAVRAQVKVEVDRALA